MGGMVVRGEFKNPRERLRKYIRQALAGNSEGEPCRVLSLWHIGLQSQERAPIQSWQVRELRADQHDAIDGIVDEVLTAAEGDCENMGTEQSYALCPIFGNDTAPTGRCMFPASPPLVDDSFDSTLVATSEPPTARGQLAQTQRHLESMHKIHAGVLAEVFRNQRMVTDQIMEMNRKLQDRVEAQEKTHLRTMQLQEELISQRHEREIKAQESQAKLAVLMTAGEALTPMLPLALGGALKNETLQKAAPSPIEVAMKTFVGNLTDEEKGNILAGLSEGNRMVLGMMLNSLGKKDGSDG